MTRRRPAHSGQVCGCRAVVERIARPNPEDDLVLECSCSVWATAPNGRCDQCNDNHHERRGQRL